MTDQGQSQKSKGKRKKKKKVSKFLNLFMLSVLGIFYFLRYTTRLLARPAKISQPDRHYFQSYPTPDCHLSVRETVVQLAPVLIQIAVVVRRRL